MSYIRQAARHPQNCEDCSHPCRSFTLESTGAQAQSQSESQAAAPSKSGRPRVPIAPKAPLKLLPVDPLPSNLSQQVRQHCKLLLTALLVPDTLWLGNVTSETCWSFLEEPQGPSASVRHDQHVWGWQIAHAKGMCLGPGQMCVKGWACGKYMHGITTYSKLPRFLFNYLASRKFLQF